MNISSLKKYFITDDISDWNTVLQNRLLVLMAFVIPFSSWWSKRIIISIFILWLFRFSKEDLLYVMQQKTVQYVFAFVALIGISWFYTEIDPGTTEYYLKRFATFLLFPLIVVPLVLKQEYIKYLIGAFLAAVFVNEVISYGILFDLWWHLDNYGFPILGEMHHSTYSVMIAFAIILVLYEIVHEDKKYKMVVYLFFLFLMLGNLVISGGRTGQFSLVFALLALLVMHYRKNMKAMFLLGLTPIIFFISVYYTYHPFSQRINQAVIDVKNTVNNDNYGSSVGNRLGSYVLLYYIIEDNSLGDTLFGHGAGELKWIKNSTIDDHHLKNFQNSKSYYQFHNIYIDVFVGMGLIGLFILVLILTEIIRIKVKKNKLRYIKDSLVLVLIFSFIPHHTFYEKNIMLIISLFVAILIVQEKSEKEVLNVS